MGLNMSHGAYDGTCVGFNKFRTHIARAIGLELREMYGFGGERDWPSTADEPLVHLLDHSDCDGSIDAKFVGAVATRVKALLDSKDQKVVAALESEDDWVRDKAETLVDGFNQAAEFGEDIEFR